MDIVDILWSSDETNDAWPMIIMADGRTLGDDGEGWREVNVPTLTELARRLLAERAEQEKLDDHNDKAEAEAQVLDLQDRLDHLESNIRSAAEAIGRNVQSDDEIRGRLSLLEIGKEILGRRLTELDENLAQQTKKLSLMARRVLNLEGSVPPRAQVDAMWEVLYNNFYAPVSPWRDGREPMGVLDFLRKLDEMLDRPGQAAAPEAPPPALPPGGLRWDRKQGIMVDDQDQIALDLSGYFEAGNMSQKDHALLEKLADLWCAWGDTGYLRERLTSGGPDPRSGGGPDWFRQLRSELLAVSWLFDKDPAKEGV